MHFNTPSRILAIAFVSTALIGCGTFQIPVAGVNNTPQTINLPNGDQSTTFEFFAGYIVLDTKIGTDGPYKFILDTGAGITVISPAVAAKLPQDFTGTTNIVSSVDPNSVSTKLIHVENLAFGTVQFSNFQAAILPAIHLTSGGQPITLDGIIGVPFFENVALTLNYPGRTVRVRNGVLPAIDNCIIVPVIRSSDGLPNMNLDVEGRTVRAVIDSGNNEVLLLPSSFSNLSFDGPTTTGTATTVTGSLTTTRGTLNGSVSFGCYDASKPMISVAGGVASLGSGLLQNFIVTLDQSSSSISFEQSTN